jgi:hypothetical protein
VGSSCGVLTGSRLGPERVLGLLPAVVQDVDDDEGVPVAEQVVDGPLQRLLGAVRVVHRHPDPALPVRPGAGHRIKTLVRAAGLWLLTR